LASGEDSTSGDVLLLFNWLYCHSNKGVNVGCSDAVEEKVMVLMVRDLEMPKSILVLVNNASRDGRVLKFVLVIRGIKKY
jgi:hypothetical protein